MYESRHRLSARRWLAAASVLWLAAPSAAQIPVDGVATKTVYTDRASFRVPTEAGYDYRVLLDGSPAPAGVFVVVDRPDYHEIFVERTRLATSVRESLTVQFIVRASERGRSEWGLPPCVPLASIPSAAPEFRDADLAIVVPDRFPVGRPVPVVALVEKGPGDRVGVNGTVRSEEVPGWSIPLLRGVGSGSLPPSASPGALAFSARVAHLERPRTVTFEDEPSWTEATGTVAVSVDWGTDARVRVAGDLTVPVGVTLSIGQGSIIECGPAAEIHVNGSLIVAGTRERPVAFVPRDRATPWGGIRFRGAAAQGDFTGTILTGSGSDPDWFDGGQNSGSSHRHEEPLIYLNGGSRVAMTDCYLIDNPTGQGGHGEGSSLALTRCLIQKCISGGQYNGGRVTLEDCAVIEMPADGAPFADDDNDALYLTGGAHSLTRTLIGWAFDDGIDAGSGSAGTVSVVDCWFESCYHEGMAWSESRQVTVSGTVAINCGQGIECGFGSPNVLAEDCLSTANIVGVRFGDNYDWDYDGFLTVTGSILIHNARDVWGRAWDDWEHHLASMDIRGNLLTAEDPLHPLNATWDPSGDPSPEGEHVARIRAFLPSAEGTVGVGFAVRSDRVSAARLAEGIPVRLSTFTTATVSVPYQVRASRGTIASGTLEFLAGETVRRVAVDPSAIEGEAWVRVTLLGPTGAELTGIAEVRLATDPTLTLIPLGSAWKYSDAGVALPIEWRQPAYDDSAWKEGAAQLGYGDGDETTTIDGGPSSDRHRTAYFRRSFDVVDPDAIGSLTVRLLRDDGAVVYVNGVEVFRKNMPAGTIGYGTLASGTAENAVDVEDLGPDVLVAGVNVIAVEVHQASADSSDLSFDLALSAALAPPVSGGFVRGDANADEAVDISDPVAILIALFQGGASDCHDALDADDSGLIDITDPILVLNYLFLSGPPMPPPFPLAGTDPTDDELGCER